MTSTRDVSIILVSWNPGAHLPRCLDSLATLAAEVIVVDNASEDGSADLVATEYPWVRLLRLPGNRGFAGGVNAGAAASRGRLLLLLNCDTVVRPQALERLVAALDAHPHCAAAGGCLIGGDGRPQHGFHVRGFPTLASLWADLWLIDAVWPSNPATRHYRAAALTAAAQGPIEVEQPVGACLLVRRDAFDALGGLDERFHPAWFEDVDFCVRLHRAGHARLFVPDAEFDHAGGASLRHLGPGTFSRIFYRNLRRYVAKHHGAGTRMAVRSLIVTGMLLRAAISVPLGRLADARAYGRVALDAMGGRERDL